MESQSRLLSRAVQVTPLSVEVWIWPPNTTAASFVPSDEEVMEIQFRLLSRAVQVSPLSVEVWIWPPFTTAASFVPSDEEVMESDMPHIKRKGSRTLSID
jgi:hypothetical protein